MNNAEIEKALQQPLYDSNIIHHGFADCMRDYEIVAQIGQEQYLYRFTHCVSVTVTTALSEDIWRRSWNDNLTRCEESEGLVEGAFLSGVYYALAYPGAELIEGSDAAVAWSARLGKEMREIQLKTNAYELRLIFHDLDKKELNPTDREWVG